ncbi:cystathionine beta-lyase [Ammoniphilus oxalaticus]|uniref:cysteine-S-conjugate beta-lyase n=1 Tax=Ammoniphilus oxalaticus TaxID=66863 RepID=A0A419SLM7_9BACL|nr:MalY/PatB family protein [Ammoniphilus oxalaticus]RKD24977.1 cystathionine beta-lyase [Ammoniphilus oxalaticus]
MSYNFDQIIDRHNTFSNKWDQTEKLFGDKDALPMWIADMDFPAPPEVIQALRERIDHGIYGYTLKPDSYFQALIDWVERRQGWTIQKEWITSSPGIVTALSILVSTLTEPGDKVLIQTPVYPPFFQVVKRNKRELVTNELQLENGRYTIDFAQLEQQFKAGVKMMLLCSPHNPVGRVWTKAELERLGALCVQYGVIVVSDEIHADLLFSGHVHQPFAPLSEALLQQTVTCYAPSKTFNVAGLKSSFVIIANDALRAKYDEMLYNLNLESESFFGVSAVEAAFRHGESWLISLMEYVEENLQLLLDTFAKRIPQIEVIQPEGTYLVWLDCRKLGLDSSELHAFMCKKAKVGLNQGTAFGTDGAGFLRMNIACPRSILVDGLDRIERAVNEAFPQK